MTQDTERLVRRQLRSPRSAAIAGILFSVLMSVSMLLVWGMSLANPAELSEDWLEASSRAASVVVALLPFSGIAFLWFTGVIRDRVGDREDRFFATVFLGAGIILVAMWFIWGAIAGALFATHAAAAALLVDYDIYIFGLEFMNRIIGDFALRMAGVYMLSIGSLWTKAKVMPRWLTIITFVVALGFVFFAGSIRETRFVFPGWVFLVSVYILVLNYRRVQDQENEDDLTQAE